MALLTYPLDGVTYDADDVQTYLCTRTSGVFADEDCFDISITDDMEVTIGTGIAWIKNTDFAGKCVCAKESTVLDISLGSGSYPRTDRIVLRFDKSSGESTIEVVEGTASSSAPAPDITQSEYTYELGLYEIYVPAGTTELTSSYITDTRLDEDVCGLMSDGVTSIPTATLQAQVEELIETLQADIDSIEAGSETMLKATYDSAGGEKQVAFAEDTPGWNILHDTDTASLTAVKGPAERYISSSGTDYAEFFELEDAPVAGLYYGVRFTGDSSNTHLLCWYQSYCVPLDEGEIYTMSCWARYVEGYEDSQLKFQYGVSAYDEQDYDLTSDWAHYSWTFTATSKYMGTQTNYGSRIYIGNIASADSCIELCGFKMEKGSVATAWTPHLDEIRYTGSVYEKRLLWTASEETEGGTTISVDLSAYDQVEIVYASGLSGISGTMGSVTVPVGCTARVHVMANLGNTYDVYFGARNYVTSTSGVTPGDFQYKTSSSFGTVGSSYTTGLSPVYIYGIKLTAD